MYVLSADSCSLWLWILIQGCSKKASTWGVRRRGRPGGSSDRWVRRSSFLHKQICIKKEGKKKEFLLDTNLKLTQARPTLYVAYFDIETKVALKLRLSLSAKAEHTYSENLNECRCNLAIPTFGSSWHGYWPWKYGFFWSYNFVFCNLVALHDEALTSFSGTLLFQLLIVLVMAVLHRKNTIPLPVGFNSIPLTIERRRNFLNW